MHRPTAHVPAPSLDLTDDTPVSSAFGDVYFSRAGGVAETEHVFLKGNGLPARWGAPIIEGGVGFASLRCASSAPYATSSLTPAARGSAKPTQYVTRIDEIHRRVASHGEPRAAGVSPQGVGGKTPFNNKFTIAELGFGTGLNFLVTLKRFRETAAAGMVLHYIAIERYPFTRESLAAVLALQPELAAEATELLAAYPLRLPGVHRIHLPRCVLTLYVGEVEKMLEEVVGCVSEPRSALWREPLAAGVSVAPSYDGVNSGGTRSEAQRGEANAPFKHMFIDAWYLDGFSPAKNPEMWRPEILAQVGRLSGEGTTFATFTSAGEVRRGLIAAGFEVKKVAGFGHKREMSLGWRTSCAGGEDAPATAPPRSLRSGSPWKATQPTSQPCVVIGAGIAGATLARALAERGIAVTVLERGCVASGASGNAAGVLFPQLTKQWNPSTHWYFTAYGFALRQLARWQVDGLSFSYAMTGMLRLPRHAEEEAQLRLLNETLGLDASIVHWLEREAASAQAGAMLQTGAAYFPHGTWINPSELCRALLQHEHIMLCEESAAISIARAGDEWAVTLASGEVIAATHVCVTSAYETAEMLANYGLRLGAVGGQVSEIAAGYAAGGLRSILCHKGYVIPQGNHYLVGATYHREAMLEVTTARHEENRTQLREILPDWPPTEVIGGRSSIRATTPDRMPYVGVLDAGLYVSTGYGSRGLLSAPLAAEIIASSMVGEMLPVTRALAQAVDPLRFRKA
jgi:tRNA 5-methylaminomethyl-2-thiouridine biosynthesis bifunctional protein